MREVEENYREGEPSERRGNECAEGQVEGGRHFLGLAARGPSKYGISVPPFSAVSVFKQGCSGLFFCLVMTVCLLATLSQVGGAAVVPTTGAAATSVSLATRRTCAHAPRASRRSTTPTVPKVSILTVKKGL